VAVAWPDDILDIKAVPGVPGANLQSQGQDSFPFFKESLGLSRPLFGFI